MKDFSSTLRLETLVENTGADKQSARFLSTAVIKHRQSRLICLTVPGGRARRKLKAAGACHSESRQQSRAEGMHACRRAYPAGQEAPAISCL